MQCKVTNGDHTDMSKTADGKDNYQSGMESPLERVQTQLEKDIRGPENGRRKSQIRFRIPAGCCRATITIQAVVNHKAGTTERQGDMV